MRKTSPRLVCALVAAYSLIALVTWLVTKNYVKAMPYCSVPLSYGDIGSSTRPRWESFQTVKVKLYPNHFTQDEKTALWDVLQEFELAGTNQNCSNVHFVEMVEEYFPIPEHLAVGDPAATDTLYLLKRSIQYFPPKPECRVGVVHLLLTSISGLMLI